MPAKFTASYASLNEIHLNYGFDSVHVDWNLITSQDDIRLGPNNIYKSSVHMQLEIYLHLHTTLQLIYRLTELQCQGLRLHMHYR